MKSRIIICLGLSLSLLLGIFALWGGISFQELTGLGIADILMYWSTPLLLAIGLASFSPLLVKSLPTKRLLVFLSLAIGVLIGGGYVLLCLCAMMPEAIVYCLSGSAVLTGIGYGLILLLWQHHLSRFSHDAIVQILLVSLALSSAGYLLLRFAMQDHARLAYPLVAVAIIILCIQAAYLPDSRNVDFRPIKDRGSVGKTIAKEHAGSLFCVSAISVAVAFTRTMALDGVGQVALINSIPSVCIIIVASSLYFVLFGLGKGLLVFRKLSILGLYRVFFPFLATALLALTIIGSPLALAVASLVYVVFSLVLMFIMLSSISVAQASKVWSPCVFGLYAGFTYLFFAGATALGAWVYYPNNLGAATFPVAIVVALYILTMSYVAIQNRKRNHGKGRRRLAADAAGGAGASSGAGIDEVSQRCSVLASQHKLTARETEIMVLMAKGRDVPSISKQLYISENTVRSHSKGVYRKLGIHSKQELIDLLETVSAVPEEEL